MIYMIYKHTKWDMISTYDTYEICAFIVKSGIRELVWKVNERSSEVFGSCARSLKPEKARLDLSLQTDSKATKKGADIGLVWLLIAYIVLAP